jgi:hypothetical protein
MAGMMGDSSGSQKKGCTDLYIVPLKTFPCPFSWYETRSIVLPSAVNPWP